MREEVGPAFHPSGWCCPAPTPTWSLDAHRDLIRRHRLQWVSWVGPCVPRYLREAVQPSGSLCGPWSQGAWVQLLGSISLASYFGSLCLSLLICEMGLKAGAQLADSTNLVHEALCHFVLPGGGSSLSIQVSPPRPPPQSGLP